MMLNNLKHKQKNHSVNSLGDQAFIGTTSTQESLMRNLHMSVEKLPPPGKNLFVIKKMVKMLIIHSVPNHVC